MTGSATITATAEGKSASAKVTVNASQVSVSAGMVKVDAGMSKFSGVVQADNVLKLVGEMRAPFRLALAEGLFSAVVGGGQMVDAREQRPEIFAVRHHAADGDAAHLGPTDQRAPDVRGDGPARPDRAVPGRRVGRWRRRRRLGEWITMHPRAAQSAPKLC